MAPCSWRRICGGKQRFFLLLCLAIMLCFEPRSVAPASCRARNWKNTTTRPCSYSGSALLADAVPVWRFYELSGECRCQWTKHCWRRGQRAIHHRRPTDHNKMAIGWRQFDTVSSNFREAGWGYTANGGVSWTFPGVLKQNVFRSDPVLNTDTSGNFFYLSSSTLSLMTCGGRSMAANHGETWLPRQAGTSNGLPLITPAALDKGSSTNPGARLVITMTAGNSAGPLTAGSPGVIR